MQITQENPLIVSSESQLEQVMAKLFVKFGFSPVMPEEREKVATEMPRKLAKKYLVDKGYLVKSDVYFRMLMEEHNVVAIKRGREHWYKVKDLDNIPARV